MREDGSFAKKQASPPALPVVVPVRVRIAQRGTQRPLRLLREVWIETRAGPGDQRHGVRRAAQLGRRSATGGAEQQ